MTLPFIQGHICMREDIPALIFWQLVQSVWPVGVLKLMLDLSHMINIQGRELYIGDFLKYL